MVSFKAFVVDIANLPQGTDKDTLSPPWSAEKDINEWLSTDVSNIRYFQCTALKTKEKRKVLMTFIYEETPMAEERRRLKRERVEETQKIIEESVKALKLVKNAD